MKLLTTILLSFFWFSMPTINSIVVSDSASIINLFDSLDPCNIENTSFKAGEVIEYKLYYNWGFIWISAGEVRFEVTENEDSYMINAIGNTYKSYNWIFPLSDTFTSIIDKKTMLPTFSSRNIHEGSYHLYEKVNYDYSNGTATVERARDNDKFTSKTHEVSDCIQDVLSSIYFLRNTKKRVLKNDKNIKFNMFLESRVYNLNLRYKGSTKSKVEKKGKIHSLHISPQLLSGNVFKDGDEMHVWVSDDDNHLPILIESPIAVGSIKALLKTHKGLRHPLNWVK